MWQNGFFFPYCLVKKLSIERFVFTIFICYRVNVLSYYVTGSINTEGHIYPYCCYCAGPVGPMCLRRFCVGPVCPLSLCRYSMGPADPVSLWSSRLSSYRGWYVSCAAFAALVTCWPVVQNVYIKHPASDRVDPPSPPEESKTRLQTSVLTVKLQNSDPGVRFSQACQHRHVRLILEYTMYIELVALYQSLHYSKAGPCSLWWRYLF